MHAVLRHFVDAASRRLLVEAEKLIQRTGTLAYRVGLVDRFCNVGFRQNHCFAELLAARKLRGNR